MYYETLLEEIRKDKISQLYLFQGEEEYLKTEALNQIKKFFFQDSAAESFNFRIFYGKDLDCVDFLNDLYTLPALSSKKLLVIKNGDRLDISSQNEISKALMTFPPSVHLIFFFQKIDKRRKLIQIIQKKGKCVNFYPLKERNLNLWVIDQFGKRGKRISRDAVSCLLSKTGDHLQNLEKEIEKVSLYTGDKTQIGLEDLKTFLCEYQIFSIYDLIDKIMEKKTEASLKILSKLIQEGKKGVELIGLFYWQFSRLWKARALQAEGNSSEELGIKLGIPPYYLTKFLNKIDNFSREELKEIFRKLLQADLRLKSTQLSPKLILELLVINLCVT